MNFDFIITDIVRVIFVGKDEYPKQITEFRGNLKCNELILHLSGSGTVKFNGKTLKTVENTIRFLPKGRNREYTVYSKENGDCIDIFFNSNRPISEQAFAMNLKNTSEIKNYFTKIFSVWATKNEGYYFECIALLYKIFAQMQRKNYITNKQNKAIAPAIQYIENNFLKEKIYVATLAEKCGISESYLKKIFVKKYSMPP